MHQNGYMDRMERVPLLETREALAPARGLWNGILLSTVLWLVAIAAFLFWSELQVDRKCEAIKKTIAIEYDLLLGAKKHVVDSTTDRWKSLMVGCSN